METGTEAEALNDMCDGEDEFFEDEYFDDIGDMATEITQKINQHRRERFAECKRKKVGETIQCPYCAKLMKKRSYQHTFCSNKGKRNCKDLYWNMVDPNRMDYIVNKR